MAAIEGFMEKVNAIREVVSTSEQAADLKTAEADERARDAVLEAWHKKIPIDAMEEAHII